MSNTPKDKDIIKLPIVSTVEVRMYDHPSLAKPVFGFAGEKLYGYSKTARDALNDFMDALEPYNRDLSDKWSGEGKLDI